MTKLDLTSGQILDIIKALEVSESRTNDSYLQLYYFNLQNQFQSIYDKLQELPGEQRNATLALLMP